MKLLRYLLLIPAFMTGISLLRAQSVPVGQWRDELPYTLCNSVTDAGDKIYCSTPYAVFYVNTEDYSVGRITKISGLSDIGISCIRYNSEYKTLVIAYTNANIDLIKDNTIINISDIKRKPILGNKTINDIYFVGKAAYLSCGFGIVVLDISKEEIRDTYYIGPQGSQVNVLSMTTDSYDSIYAATEKGIYKSWAKDPNLANFASWHRDLTMDTAASYNTIVSFSDRIVVNKQGNAADTLCIFSDGQWNRWERDYYNKVMNLQAASDYLGVSYNYFVCAFDENFNLTTTVWNYDPGNPYPNDALIDASGNLWIADTYSGMVMYRLQTGAIQHFSLSGPLSALAFSMNARGNDLVIAPGGRDASFTPLYYPAQVYHFDNTNWNNVTSGNSPLMGTAYDIVVAAIDPSDSKRIYAGSFGRGVLEIYNDVAINRYTEGNSTLRHHTASDTSDVRVGGLTFDKQGNLWVVTSHNNSCLSMKQGNTWTGFTIPAVNENDLGQIMVTSPGQKWIQMRYGNMNPNSLIVFTDNNTPGDPSDDQSRLLNSTVGNGNIPGNTVNAMAEDLNGEIWVGTEKGVAVFYSPEKIFTGENFDCQRILVQQGSYVQYLLENETVTAIAVDGANQKWIGTDRGGVYCFSQDGTKEKYHFTAENSPLLSDRIICLAINKDGDVFFGTDKGVISFRGPATPGGETNENVYAFPNPVPSDFTGYIAIKGLVADAQIRITDVNGVLVYSTRAYGGQAIWDGKNFDGRKAKSGVYLVYASNDGGSEKVVTKILVTN